jgi:hypothetical protein
MVLMLRLDIFRSCENFRNSSVLHTRSTKGYTTFEK